MNQQYITTLGGRNFVVESNMDMVLSPEQINQINTYVAQKLGILGTATCGGPYAKGTSKHLTGSVTSGGTAPFTYSWTITKPDGTKTTLTGATQTYIFSQAGTYKTDLVVTDSCPSGAKSDTATCNVVITAECVVPACNINMT